MDRILFAAGVCYIAGQVTGGGGFVGICWVQGASRCLLDVWISSSVQPKVELHSYVEASN